MAFSTLMLVLGPLPPAAGGNDLHLKRPTMTITNRAVPLQLRSEGEQKVQAVKASSVSRRDMMLCLSAASLGGVYDFLFLTEPVEARTVKPEIRRKIREKLDMLREKAGVLKPKTDGENTNLPQPLAMDKKLPPLTRRPPPPNPQRSPVVPLVESILP
ncbi:hypothetical protein L1049_005709 [Liquidambar formosana]|uniref:Uncharacterized protein n=1 Tax=Liquidambar formosana TaxID=63359 RepID=A0AAP0RG57_LIQFO